MVDHSANFRNLSEELCQLIEAEGLSVRPYKIPTLPYFLQLTTEQKDTVLQHLQSYLDICRTVRLRKHSLKETPYFVRTALEYFGFQVDETVFESIDTDTMVEFYSLNHTQIFRTLHFFEYSSYTLEDIYCRQWIHLYDRDLAVSQEFLRCAELMIKGGAQVMVPEIGEHFLVERASLEKLKFRARTLCVATLKKGPDIAAFLNVNISEPVFEKIEEN